MTLKVGYLGLEGSDLVARERFAGLVGLAGAHHGDVTCLLVDDARQVVECDNLSLWGHQRAAA